MTPLELSTEHSRLMNEGAKKYRTVMRREGLKFSGQQNSCYSKSYSDYEMKPDQTEFVAEWVISDDGHPYFYERLIHPSYLQQSLMFPDHPNYEKVKLELKEIYDKLQAEWVSIYRPALEEKFPHYKFGKRQAETERDHLGSMANTHNGRFPPSPEMIETCNALIASGYGINHYDLNRDLNAPPLQLDTLVQEYLDRKAAHEKMIDDTNERRRAAYARGEEFNG